MGQNGREIPCSAPEFPADTDLLIVMLGTNDLLQGRGPKQVIEKSERFLSGLPLDQSKILLIAPPPMTLGTWVPSPQLIDDSHTFAQLCQTLAEHLLASGDNRHSGSGEKRQFWSTENSHLQFE